MTHNRIGSQPWVRAMLAAALVAVAALAISACGGDDSTSGGSTTSSSASTESDSGGETGEMVKIDVGTTVIEAEKSPPRVAVVPFAAGTTFSGAWVESAEETADELGLTFQVFDSAGDPTKQRSVIQNVLQSGEFDAIAVEPVSSQICNAVTKEAPDAGIVVWVSDVVACEDKVLVPFDEIWSEGTAGFVGAQSSLTAFEGYFNTWEKGLEEPFILVTGPKVVPVTQQALTALENVGVTPTAVVETDFTTADSFAKTQTALQANPDVTTLLSPSSAEITGGVVKAIEALGKEDEITNFYAVGGSKQELPAIESGLVTEEAVFFPRTTAREAITALAELFEGKDVPHTIEGLERGTAEKPYIIDQSNVAEFEPQW